MSEYFIIQGKRPLQGEVRVTGNKNAALPMLAATLLTDEPVTLHNVPRIGDVNTMLGLLKALGVEVLANGNATLTLQARNVATHMLDRELATQIRASILLAGPLLA
ncbi:MAG TPA: UDP-N-acetylglucosamine 1-carboxyvinyltransferase, partial [Anaerolineae bacterium]|nr:UDP-N-acetylglucosamine 1-carboxyvinyltransferase [Anaerolineae bacterium]